MPDTLIRLLAPDCIVLTEPKTIVLPKHTDTQTFSFFVRAEREGIHVINVELLHAGYAVVEQMLQTKAVEYQGPKGGPTGLQLIAEVPLQIVCVARAASVSGG